MSSGTATVTSFRATFLGKRAFAAGPLELLTFLISNASSSSSCRVVSWVNHLPIGPDFERVSRRPDSSIDHGSDHLPASGFATTRADDPSPTAINP